MADTRDHPMTGIIAAVPSPDRADYCKEHSKSPDGGQGLARDMLFVGRWRKSAGPTSRFAMVTDRYGTPWILNFEGGNGSA